MYLANWNVQLAKRRMKMTGIFCLLVITASKHGRQQEFNMAKEIIMDVCSGTATRKAGQFAMSLW
ncbi:hypothetical protein A2U01_0058320, partial [Trifolium medium]|nr:hypothetical protein [Trifolium medium]